VGTACERSPLNARLLPFCVKLRAVLTQFFPARAWNPVCWWDLTSRTAPTVIVVPLFVSVPMECCYLRHNAFTSFLMASGMRRILELRDGRKLPRGDTATFTTSRSVSPRQVRGSALSRCVPSLPVNVKGDESITFLFITFINGCNCMGIRRQYPFPWAPRAPRRRAS
jgi:hypothetical protein